MLRTLLLALIILDALAVYGVWIAEFAGGVVVPAQVLAASTEQVLRGLHVLALLLTAGVLAAAAAGVRSSRRWARPLAWAGVGMVVYAGVNELSWALVAGGWPALPMLAAQAIAARTGSALRSDAAGHAAVGLGVLAAFALADALWVYTPWRHPLWRPSPLEGVMAPHLVAEAMMATASLIGAIAVLARRRWGPATLAYGLGAGVVAAICAAGWALVNQPAVLVPMGLAVVVNTAMLAVMMRPANGRPARQEGSR